MPKPTTFKAFRPEPELAQAMQKLKERDGISDSEQIRRGVKLLLKAKGITYKEKKR